MHSPGSSIFSTFLKKAITPKLRHTIGFRKIPKGEHVSAHSEQLSFLGPIITDVPDYK